ncbi:TonB family protein [Parvularcula marina]|uniref:TonB family protein n=1 Tax=Parvularcula marina TaxID=2292771 RepID=A0A371RFF7_9PROT|nr:TonB family protein [Parvularcula marina]RFB04189.1 TonB family protein [Parvularcula marina]
MDVTDTLLHRDRDVSHDGTSDGNETAASESPSTATSEADADAPHTNDGKIPSADDFSHAGEMLAAAREAMDLDVEEISKRINVKAERLTAIEALDKSALPAPTFTLGFVRSYARTLGLPEDALVERFRRDAGYPAPRQTPVLEPKLQKDLGPAPQMSLFTILLITGGVLWIVWQILQASAPDKAVLTAEGGEGIPLVERTLSSTGVPDYQMTTSLTDENALGGGLSLPSDAAPARVADAGEDDGVLEITAEELERALAAGEEEARSASLANARAAENDGALQVAAVEIPSPLTEAEEGEGDIDSAAAETVSEETETATEANTGVQSADELNAEALNRLALQNRGTTTEEAPATQEETLAEDDTADEPVMTDDGIAIVTADENAPAETVVEETVVASRVPATIRTAIEPVYPSRCESSAAETETVTIRYSVSRYGKVVGPEVASTTNPCFNRAAMAAVSRWDFFPAEEGGASVTDAGRTSRVVFQRP